MNNSNKARVDFASKVGMVLATAGSAVGLGNIWRFPVMTGQSGGGAFLIIYILCVIALGLPLMTAEFIVGRHAHTNTAQAYKKLSNGWLWRKIGKFGVFTGWFILCYYIVVSGWALDYFVDALLGKFSRLAQSGDPDAYAHHFQSFVQNPWMPAVYALVFILMSHFVIVKGVKKGIERFSKIMMPLLFIILAVLAVCSLFTAGAKEGLTFLFRPDLSKITFKTILAAMGQAFYSLSIAMGCLCTFASYFSKDANLVGTAVKVGIIDTIVAIMSGIIIFPAVFSTNLSVDAGPSLVFIALPNVFHQAFSSMPLLGYFVSVLFYFLLILATLTSVISLHEVPTAYLSEDFHMSRTRATTIVTGSVIVVGSICSLSMGPLKDLTLGGKNIFDLFDFVSGQIFLPIGGFLIALFVGWFLQRRIIYQQLTNCSTLPPRGMRSIILLLKYFVPVAIMFIFLSGLGVFDWL